MQVAEYLLRQIFGIGRVIDISADETMHLASEGVYKLLEGATFSLHDSLR